MNFREHEWKKQIKSQEQKVLRLQQLEIERDKKLREIAMNVPYYLAIKHKTSNLQKTTAARFNDTFEPSADCDLEDFQQGARKLHSFSNAKVFSDTKFRLAHELHESGMAHTAYACAVVKQLIPRQIERTTGIEPA